MASSAGPLSCLSAAANSRPVGPLVDPGSWMSAWAKQPKYHRQHPPPWQSPSAPSRKIRSVKSGPSLDHPGGSAQMTATCATTQLRHTIETPTRGHEKESRERSASEIMESPPTPGIRSFPGDRTSRPREGSFRRPPLAEFSVGARSFVENSFCAAMWGGRGAIVRPRGVRWRSGEPFPRGAY